MRISGMNFRTKRQKNRADSVFLNNKPGSKKWLPGSQGVLPGLSVLPPSLTLQTSWFYCPLADDGLPQSRVCLQSFSAPRDGLSFSGVNPRTWAKSLDRWVRGRWQWGELPVQMCLSEPWGEKTALTEVGLLWLERYCKRNHHRSYWVIEPTSLCKQTPSASDPEGAFAVGTNRQTWRAWS